MSRNFELLERISAERGTPKFDDAVVSAVRHRPRPDPHALSRDELTKLAQRVFLLSNPEGQRAVVFTGEQRGSGCSSILAGVGEVLASQTDREVCLVDANVQRPALHLCFGVENVKGLANAVTEAGPVRQFMQKLPGGKLWLLPWGPSSSRLGFAVIAEKFQQRLSELRREFAYILMDSPPVNGRADAILLGKLADGVVLVLEANVSRRDAARIAKEICEAAQVRVLGAVLNKRTFPVPAWLYERV